MADIRINALPVENNPVASEAVAIDGATTRQTTVQKLVYAGRPTASQAEAEAGTDPDKAMTPLNTAQAISAQAGAIVEDTLETLGMITNPINAVKLQTIAVDGQLEYSLLSPVPTLNGHLHLNVIIGNGAFQPKDGLAYTVTTGGTKILFSEQPTPGINLYAEGAAVYGISVVSAGPASTIVNDSIVPGSSVKAALESVNAPAMWDSATTRTNAARAQDTYCILDAPGGADPTGGNDSTVAIRSMLAAGVRCEITKGDFVWDNAVDSRGMVIATHNQQIIGHGSGWGRGDQRASTFVPHSRIIVTGTGGRIVRSRRQPRLVVGDAQDAATSAAMHIAADNVSIKGLCLWLDTDYSNMSPSNLGADIDYGVFVATRTGYHDEDFQIYGSFRKGGKVLDNTAISGGTILGPSGYTLPAIISRGTDAWRFTNSMVSGARRAIVIQGSIPTGTANYYDQTLGLITDTRGSFGASDGFIDGGMYSPDHHSLTRLGVLRGDLNHLLEDENMPCCLFIDGWANNAASAIQGIACKGNYRFETIEGFHVRLGRSNRIRFDGGMIDYRFTADPNYGSITATPNTQNVHIMNGFVSTPIKAYFDDQIVGKTRTNVGPINGVTQLQDLTLDGPLRMSSGEMQLYPGAGEIFRVRNGATTILQIDPLGIYDNTSASGSNVVVTGNNQLQRSTSSGRYKTDVEDLAPDFRDKVLALRAVWYRSLCAADNPDWSWYGLIAEEVAAIEPRWVHWRTTRTEIHQRVVEQLIDGRLQEITENYEVIIPLDEPVPEGVAYERIVPHLVAFVQDHEMRLAALEAAQ